MVHSLSLKIKNQVSSPVLSFLCWKNIEQCPPRQQIVSTKLQGRSFFEVRTTTSKSILNCNSSPNTHVYNRTFFEALIFSWEDESVLLGRPYQELWIKIKCLAPIQFYVSDSEQKSGKNKKNGGEVGRSLSGTTMQWNVLMSPFCLWMEVRPRTWFCETFWGILEQTKNSRFLSPIRQ